MPLQRVAGGGSRVAFHCVVRAAGGKASGHNPLPATRDSRFHLDEGVRGLHALALGKDEERIDVEL